MKAVYSDFKIPEQEAKRRYFFPEFIMMENAATALMNEVQLQIDAAQSSASAGIFIVCGSGNNGADGICLARKLQGKYNAEVFLTGEPKTDEGKLQYKMAQAAGVNFLEAFPECKKLNSYVLIVDCILGTGFYGELRPEIAQITDAINAAPAIKICCDVPTGMKVKNDCTVTMGAYKTELFSDEAKKICGTIKTAHLGISEEKFIECSKPDAWLVTEEDIKLPLRNDKSVHKGSFGHTAVIAGEKSGAGIISATAAMNFGSGLTTLVKTKNSNLEQFKISPSLMISDSIPQNATCVAIGSGLGTVTKEVLSPFVEWYKNAKSPACVIDADLFSYEDLPALLEDLNDVSGGKIILTPHPKELHKLYTAVFPSENEKPLSIQEIIKNRIEIGKKITEKLKNVTVIMKSANTFIAGISKLESEPQVYIVNSGRQYLAKGGSGDVLAGMNAALLAQGYEAIPAANTAAFVHGAACGTIYNESDFSVTPEKLIEAVAQFGSRLL